MTEIVIRFFLGYPFSQSREIEHCDIHRTLLTLCDEIANAERPFQVGEAQ
jgi:hypothetical protein